MTTVVGAVDVEIRGRPDSFERSLADSKRQAELFEKEASGTFKEVGKAAETMGQKVQSAAATAKQAQTDLARAARDVAAAQGDAARATKSHSEAQAELARRTKESNDQLRKSSDFQKKVNDWAGFKGNNSSQGTAAASARVFQEHFARQAAEAEKATKGVADAVEEVTEKTDDLGSAAGRTGGIFSRVMGSSRTGVLALLLVLARAVQEADKLEKAINKVGDVASGSGRGSGLGSAELEEIARKGAAAAKTTIQEARDLEFQLLKTGKVGGDVFLGLAEVQAKYARATGQDLKGAQSELADAMADPARMVEILDSRFGALDSTTKEYLLNLIAQGRQQEAAAASLRILQTELKGVDSDLGGLADAWNWVKRTTEGAIDAVERYGDAAAKAISMGRFGAGQARRDMEESLRQREKAFEVGLNRATTAAAPVAKQYDSRRRLTDLTAEAQVLGRGAMAAAIKGDTKAVTEFEDALGKVNRARQTFMTDSEKAHKLAELDTRANEVRAQSESAATRATLGEIAAERVRIEMAGEVVSATEVETKARDAAAVASSRQSRAGANRGASLAREAESMEASAAGALALAEAYLKSDDAALRAEASRAAMTRAARSGADAEAQARRQLALAIAEQAAAGGKMVAQARAEAVAAKAVNDNLAAGTMTALEAQRAMQSEAALRPLLAAQAIAEGKAKETLTEVIDALREAYAALHAEESRGEVIRAGQAQADDIRHMELELSLIGKTNAERRTAIALLEAELALRAMGVDLASEEGKAYLARAARIAELGNQQESGEFVDRARQDAEAQIRAWQLEAQMIGMTHREAAAYRYEKELLNNAYASGVTLGEDELRTIAGIADAYGAASEAARVFNERQAAVAEAADYLGTTLNDVFSGLINDVDNGNEALLKLIRSLGDALQAALLFGEGPLAGIFGTKDSGTVGGGKGGFMNSGARELTEWLFGKPQAPTGPAGAPAPAAGIAGLPGSVGGLMGAAPRGTAGDPIFVALSGGMGGTGGGGSGVAGILGNIAKTALTAAFGGGGIPGFDAAGASASAAALNATNASLVAAGLHGGGTYETASFRRVLPAAAFLNAPRFHNGFRPDEFPAVLQRGERVLSRAEVANDNAMGFGPPVNINVYGVQDTGQWLRNDRQIAGEFKRRYRLS